MAQYRIYDLAQDLGIKRAAEIVTRLNALGIKGKTSSSHLEEAEVKAFLDRYFKLKPDAKESYYSNRKEREAKEQEQETKAEASKAERAEARKRERVEKARLKKEEEKAQREAEKKAKEEEKIAAKKRAQEEAEAASAAKAAKGKKKAQVEEAPPEISAAVTPEVVKAVPEATPPPEPSKPSPVETAAPPSTVEQAPPAAKIPVQPPRAPVPATAAVQTAKPKPATAASLADLRKVAMGRSATPAERAAMKPRESARGPQPHPAGRGPSTRSMDFKKALHPTKRLSPQDMAQARMQQPIHRPPMRGPGGQTIAAPAPSTQRRGRGLPARPGERRSGRGQANLENLKGLLRPQPKAPVAAVPREFRTITITEGVTIKELSEKLDVKGRDLIKKLLEKGIFVTINQTLDAQSAIDLAMEFNAEAKVVSFEEAAQMDVVAMPSPEKLLPRPPVVTVMGHVDHGKTSLLDAIRKTNVTEGEAGGITQHIGAYQVETKGRRITFLDTPGHEAFTLMRARGASVTDIVILVVAADDGIMQQTREAIDHARAAKVPIIVAINKIDKTNALPERVKKQLTEMDLMPEEWGGKTVTVEVSAKQHTNIDLLLEMILLVADMAELKADPDSPAMGTVLEAKLDRGRGAVATVLVQNGTLQNGDSFIVGAQYGKVRALFDYKGNPTASAPPATPVEVLGLEGVPQAGDKFQVLADTLKAKQIGLYRQSKLREQALAKSSRLTLDQLHEQLAAGTMKELPLILKADVQGSVEVLSDMVQRLSNDRVKVKVLHSGVGAITETDVLLASASNAIIIGFSVRPERKASDLADQEKVDIRLHTIIYEITDEIKRAMSGLLEAQYREVYLGRAEVRDTFRIPKVGTVAGSYIQDGKISRNSEVRLTRDNVVIYEGHVASLRRFKDDVSEVKSGFECGIALQNFNDIKQGDVIEAFINERVAAEAV
ncbi:MAG: translation initiation factor IF-2 [Acidobacteriia bacterium]|nr:translation initiation factor IF-2 [Terriglobia bacterium]